MPCHALACSQKTPPSRGIVPWTAAVVSCPVKRVLFPVARALCRSESTEHYRLLQPDRRVSPIQPFLFLLERREESFLFLCILRVLFVYSVITIVVVLYKGREGEERNSLTPLITPESGFYSRLIVLFFFFLYVSF